MNAYLRKTAGTGLHRSTMCAMSTDSARRLGYELINQEGEARRGRFTTAHGVVETPASMPVAPKPR